MNEMILLKLGELVLKGLNRRSFEDKLQANIHRRLKNLGKFRVYTRQSTTYVEPMEESCDVDAAYEAMKRSATTEGKHNAIRPDIDPYIEHGYIPVGIFTQDMSGDNSVSHALEYYVADNALAAFALEMGDEAFAKEMERRAAGWRNYYSKADGAMRPIGECRLLMCTIPTILRKRFGF